MTASPPATRAASRCRAYDVHCPLGSLPLALKTEPASIPADIPYLRADEARLAKWRPRIEALPGKRVALAWAGNASHANDRNRSIDLKLLEPLLALEGVSFVSIQRELRGERCRAAGAPAQRHAISATSLPTWPTPRR